MDQVVAARMEKELAGQEVGGWKLAECIGYGKSALVFRASRGTENGAVKIFDRELVEKFGKEVQRARVLREKALVGKHHPNLIEILDAGEDAARDLFFVVMALMPGRNMAEALPAIPHDRVSDLIAQVASAAQFLETEGLVHRDIKPENIGVADDFSTATLLDLGVLRPVGFSSVTDQDGQKVFVGTLQYSPPELLHRVEEDSREGWRAVSFYQLGAVLHDLLTRKPLFADDLTPYAHLVEAVSHKTVTISAPGAAPELRMLAQDCLVKDPKSRLQLVSWDRFQKPPAPPGDMNAVRERIAQRRHSAVLTAPSPAIAPGAVAKQAIGDLRTLLERLLRDGCKQADMPPFLVQTDSTIANVRLIFGPSRSHATKGTLVVFVNGDVVDVSGGIVHVRAAAVNGTQSELLPTLTPPPEKEVSVFRGVLADDVLASRLSALLLLALDATQELSGQGRVAAAPAWLELPESH